jgi:DNA-binding NarL/FixJ family response regulator
MGGLEAARVLREAHPDLKILMLSMHDNEQYFLEALRLGAGGYVLKSQADNDLIKACRSTMRGESFVYPQTEHLLLSHAVKPDAAADVARLTRREAQILRLIAEGHTAREIADQLVISPRTVERHRENLLDKLELRNRVELTRYAIRVGLIEP